MTTRAAWLGIALALAACPSAATTEPAAPLRLAGAEVGAEGVLTERQGEVVGGAGPTRTPILVIEGPRIEGASSAILGTVAAEGVEGEGYLEMWSEFPDGRRSVSRTLGASGPQGRLVGTAGARPFAVPVSIPAGAPAPVRLELFVALAGPGRVALRDLRLVSGNAPALAGLSPRAAGWLGAGLGSAIGLAGAAYGIACTRTPGRGLRAESRPHG